MESENPGKGSCCCPAWVYKSVVYWSSAGVCLRLSWKTLALEGHVLDLVDELATSDRQQRTILHCHLYLWFSGTLLVVIESMKEVVAWVASDFLSCTYASVARVLCVSGDLSSIQPHGDSVHGGSASHGLASGAIWSHHCDLLKGEREGRRETAFIVTSLRKAHTPLLLTRQSSVTWVINAGKAGKGERYLTDQPHDWAYMEAEMELVRSLSPSAFPNRFAASHLCFVKFHSCWETLNTR